tara:strand:+ start:63 stop:812 length:750 start_codon:yes stop_codon:yes gene_type:complete
MSHDFKKYKLLRKIANLFGFKLVEKNYIKNVAEIEIHAVKVEKFVDKIIKNNGFKKIIQIGSNDGITDDYVKKIIETHNLESLLIEPSPEPFKRLKENYKEMRDVTLINKALDAKNSNKNFYIVNQKFEEYYHENISVLSSFDKNHLIKWGVKSKHIKSINVECINWLKLFESFSFQNVQIVCIDAEGYDHILVQDLLNTTKVRPVIVFEWVNIPNEELKRTFNLLKENKYEFLKFQKDLISFKSNIII